MAMPTDFVDEQRDSVLGPTWGLLESKEGTLSEVVITEKEAQSPHLPLDPGLHVGLACAVVPQALALAGGREEQCDVAARLVVAAQVLACQCSSVKPRRAP